MNLERCLQELKRCAISLMLIVLGVFLATQNAPAAESAAKAINSCNMIRNSLTILSTCPGPRAFRQVEHKNRHPESPRRQGIGNVRYIASFNTGLSPLHR